MTTGSANRSLMVIDDDSDLRGMLQHMFRERGYDATTASVGRLLDKPLDLKELSAAVDELLARTDGRARVSG
jgi:CheY-like chemotaxis protein